MGEQDPAESIIREPGPANGEEAADGPMQTRDALVEAFYFAFTHHGSEMIDEIVKYARSIYDLPDEELVKILTAMYQEAYDLTTEELFKEEK